MRSRQVRGHDVGSLGIAGLSGEDVSARIAEAVVRVARDSGVGQPIPDDAIPAAVRQAMWMPDYPKYLPA